MMHTLRKQSRRVFGVIIALQLATSFGAIALLTRMGPTIARVAEENIESLTAAEQMIVALVDSSGVHDAERNAFFEALTAAENNVTEAAEVPLLHEIRGAADSALSGDAGARSAVLRSVRQLAEVNRSALRRADREAQRLAAAGAWAAVVLAVIAYLFVRYIANRVERQFVMPVLEVSHTLDAVRQGDRFRRCAGSSGSPDVQNLLDGVNALLDREASHKG